MAYLAEFLEALIRLNPNLTDSEWNLRSLNKSNSFENLLC